MKKYIYVILLFLGCIAGCTPDDDYSAAKYEYVGIRASGTPNNIPEDSEVPVSIPVYYGGEFSNPSSFTVSYTVTGGTYGTDYTIVGGTSPSGTVTIEQGEAGSAAMGVIKIQPVADFITEPNVVLTITLNEASNGISLGYPLAKTFRLTVADDDCEFVLDDFTGTAESYEIDGGDVYGPYDTEFVVVDGTTLEMDNFWDSGMVVQVVLDPDTRTVEIVPNTWNQYGYTWSIEGSGKINTCGKTMAIDVHFSSPDYQGGSDYTLVAAYEF